MLLNLLNKDQLKSKQRYVPCAVMVDFADLAIYIHVTHQRIVKIVCP